MLKTWDTLPYFGLNGLSIALVIPSPPLIKFASNTRPRSKLGGTTLNRREGGGQFISDSSDLKQEGSFFSSKCLNIFPTGYGCLSHPYVYSRIVPNHFSTGWNALYFLHLRKEVVIKKQYFLSLRVQNGQTKTAVFATFVYVVICKKLGF